MKSGKCEILRIFIFSHLSLSLSSEAKIIYQGKYCHDNSHYDCFYHASGNLLHEEESYDKRHDAKYIVFEIIHLTYYYLNKRLNVAGIIV